jgi:hypothetical protein
MKLALAIAAALLVAFAALTWLALEAGDVAIVETRADDGSSRATHVWFTESDGELWLEAGSPENPWFADLGRDPRLVLRAEGHDGDYLGERRDDLESRARVRARLLEKYGWRDRWVGLWFVDQSKSLVVRLVPVPAP